MADETDFRLVLDTEEKRMLKDQACEELIAEGLIVSQNNIQTRYLKLYEEKYGKEAKTMGESMKAPESMGRTPLNAVIDQHLYRMTTPELKTELKIAIETKEAHSNLAYRFSTTEELLAGELRKRGENPYEFMIKKENCSGGVENE